MTKYIHTEQIHNTTSAEIILPIIFDKLFPKSVLDIGCGIGTWLSVAKSLGAESVLGVDGDYVDMSLVEKYISKDEFISIDLNSPIRINKRFDLALCLEVAEHLEEESADNLVKSLVDHSDVILFSAAIPGQNGQNHLNEKWANFWIDKFEKLGYSAYDLVRPQIWDNQDVQVWYRQNIFVFSKKEIDYPQLDYSNLVHPDLWLFSLSQKNNLVNRLKRIQNGEVGLPFYLKGAIKSLKFFGIKRK